jgi:hypothetical protein
MASSVTDVGTLSGQPALTCGMLPIFPKNKIIFKNKYINFEFHFLSYIWEAYPVTFVFLMLGGAISDKSRSEGEDS